jgi:hypothetical protein
MIVSSRSEKYHHDEIHELENRLSFDAFSVDFLKCLLPFYQFLPFPLSGQCRKKKHLVVFFAFAQFLHKHSFNISPEIGFSKARR